MTATQHIRFWDIHKGSGAVDLVEKSLYSADYQRLCALLVRLRHQAGLTQVKVAGALGVPQSFVSKYESGQRRLDVIELDHIAAVLGTTLHNIVDGLKDPSAAPPADAR
jgi:transcriptional regulator with XRE-family HTH domain